MNYIKSKSRARYNKNGWYSRGYLPHNVEANMTQFITLRLADSLPKIAIERMIQSELINESDAKGKLLLHHKINQLLDSGYGECYLNRNEIAQLVVNSLHYYHPKDYQLHEWVIMPNHIHVLLTMNNGQLITKLIESIKSYTAKEANKILNRKGPFWYREYYDRYIRNERHFEHARHYIYNNPVMAGLCKNKEDWVFSSYN